MAAAVHNLVHYRINDGSHHRRENVFSKIVKVALAAILIGAVILTLTASLPITLILSPIGTYFLFTSNRLSSYSRSFSTIIPRFSQYTTFFSFPNNPRPAARYPTRSHVGNGRFNQMPSNPQSSYERTRAPVGTGQRSRLSSQRKDPQRTAER